MLCDYLELEMRTNPYNYVLSAGRKIITEKFRG